ncbi:MAG: hypothetical protein J6A19_04900 [Oscillospiraceae bacterium]|nr:hypothetical protein [Oscillospiraceae bacterium]
MAAPICPICKAGDKSGSRVRCRRFGGLVCMEHCSKCNWFSGYDTTVVHCFWGQENVPPRNDGTKQN